MQALSWTLIAQLVKNHLQCRRPWFNSWVGKIPWTRDRLPTPVFLGFPCGSAGKESTCNVGDLGWIPGLGRSPGEGKGELQYSGLENSLGSQRVRHHWVTFTFTFFHFFQTRLIKKKKKAPISKIKVSEKILYKMPEIFLKKEY